MRYWKYNKPVSMLIHTSQNQKDHDKIFELINTWFKKINQEELLEEASKVWVSEVSQFSKDHFKGIHIDIHWTFVKTSITHGTAAA